MGCARRGTPRRSPGRGGRGVHERSGQGRPPPGRGPPPRRGHIRRRGGGRRDGRSRRAEGSGGPRGRCARLRRRLRSDAARRARAWPRSRRRDGTGDAGGSRLARVNLAQSLLYAAERNPDAEAVVEGEERLTYARLRDRAAQVSSGLELGKRVAAVVRSRLDTVVLYWACQWAGATFVPLSPRASAADLQYCREDSGAALLIEVDAE